MGVYLGFSLMDDIDWDAENSVEDVFNVKLYNLLF